MDAQARRAAFHAVVPRLLLAGLPAAALWAWSGSLNAALIVALGGAGGLLCWAAVLRGGPVEIWGRALLILVLCVVTGAALQTGGPESPALVWLLTLPLLAGLLLGSRDAVGALFLATLALAGLWARDELAGGALLPDRSAATRAAPDGLVDTLLLVGSLLATAWIAQAWAEAVRCSHRRGQRWQRNFRAAVDDAPEGLLLLQRLAADEEGREPDFAVVYSNEATAEFFGQRPEEGTRLSTWLDGPRGALLRREFARVQEEQSMYRKRGLPRSASDRVIDLVAAHWGDGVAVCFFDVTTRARVEDQLRGATRAAEEANRAKSHFLANISHELRTPMNGIQGMAELALETETTEEQGEFLQTIHDCTESMSTVLNEILDLSKIDSGGMRLEPVEFDLEEILESVLESLAIDAADQENEWNALADPAVPARLVGDAGRLRQVLLNLASNAHKFTRQGEVALRVALEEDREGWVSLRFAVRDDGVGIEAERIPLLFEKFTRPDESTSRPYESAGLGLSICKELVERMGGEIRVESALGEGSVFHFALRFGVAPGGREAAKAPPHETVGLPALVVSHCATSRSVLAGQMRRLGCWYDSCNDSREAWRKLESARAKGQPFALMLLDNDLPGTSGQEFVRRVYAHPDHGELRTILLTRLRDRPDLSSPKLRGRVARLTKPARRRLLLRVLLRLLDVDAWSVGDPTAPPAGPADRRRGPPRAEGGPAMRDDDDARRVDGRILLAEDIAVNQRLVQGMLRTSRVRLDIVENGAEAVKAVQSRDYDLILMDCQMPEMDGYEATRRIRELGGRASEVPIVALTANAMHGDSARCFAAGMDGYLSKPFKRQDFHGMLKYWLSGSRARDPQ